MSALAMDVSADVDGGLIEAGPSHQGLGGSMRLALVRDWGETVWRGDRLQLDGYWMVGLGRWRDDDGPTGERALWEAGVTPVLQLAGRKRNGLYLEAGIGAHLLSRTRHSGRRLGTAFQFGDLIGVGYRHRARGWALGYRFTHYSNAGIDADNDGKDFHRLVVRFDVP